jgi:hypothetical protein
MNDVCDSPLNARRSIGRPTRPSANTPWHKSPRPSSSPSAPNTRKRTSPNSSAASPPSTPPSSAGQASRPSSSNAFPPTSANRPSSSRSPRVHQATPTDSASYPTPSISPDRFILMPPPHLQVHRQGHTHRATHIRHIPRPTRGRGHPAPRGTLPPRRWHRYRSRADPVRRGEPGDAGRGRLARKDLVGRAERLGGGARALCRHRPVGLQANLDDREGVSNFFFSLRRRPPFVLTTRLSSQSILWLIGCTRCCDLV